jgi:hypothetical protein
MARTQDWLHQEVMETKLQVDSHKKGCDYLMHSLSCTKYFGEQHEKNEKRR